MLRVDDRVVIWNLFSLCQDNYGSLGSTSEVSKKPSRNQLCELTDSGCFFSSNMSSERFESLQEQKVETLQLKVNYTTFVQNDPPVLGWGLGVFTMAQPKTLTAVMPRA